MKLIYILMIIFFLGCSFDNKTGIWQNENIIAEQKNDSTFKDFKKTSSEIEDFNKTVLLKKNYNFKIDEPFLNKYWNDIFYAKNNNLRNFKYSNYNRVINKSKKLTKNEINNYKIYTNENIIFSDKKGNIIIYSTKKKSIFLKYNFYKNQFKNVDKILNLAEENDVIYISDNIGYIYAYNYLKNQIIWAKNYKIPFLSNIKLLPNKLIAANQNNELYILNKLNGNLIKKIPTENTTFKNLFRNNISLNKDTIFFLNTYGSLYSIDQTRLNINWFINLNSSSSSSLSNLFSGSIIVNNNKKLLVSSNQNFYLIDNSNGSILSKKNFSTILRPIIINKYIFLITNNNFLLALDFENGEIIHSHSISEKVAEFTNTKKKKIYVKNILLAENELFIFLKNSYIIKYNLTGEIIDIIKLPSNLESNPVLVNNSIFYLSNKKKLFTLN